MDFDKSMSCNELGPDSRIDFVFRAEGPVGGYGQTVEYKGNIRQILLRLPAKVFFNEENEEDVGKLSYKLLNKSVVIIGGSFKESRDFYTTPLGQMPGALVLINAIYTLQAYGGPIFQAPLWFEAVAVIIFVAMTSLAFYFLPKLLASALATILMVWGVAFGFYFFGQAWLAPVIPLGGITVLEWVRNPREWVDAISELRSGQPK